MKINELHYSSTNTYLIEGDNGLLLFDTGWAGTLPAFFAAMGALKIPVQTVDFILISHFHPDHMGIAQEIADLGPRIVVMDFQLPFVHASDDILSRDKRSRFIPIHDDRLKIISSPGSRDFLKTLGIEGEILHTPGHSDDSLSLCLDDGTLFVGDLNPLYELDLHKGTRIAESWDVLLTRKPRKVFYGHARPAELKRETARPEEDKVFQKQTVPSGYDKELHALVMKIMKYIDKGVGLDKISRKTGADAGFVEDVARMYLTHQNVGVQGILDRIEIKNR